VAAVVTRRGAAKGGEFVLVRKPRVVVLRLARNDARRRPCGVRGNGARLHVQRVERGACKEADAVAKRTAKRAKRERGAARPRIVRRKANAAQRVMTRAYALYDPCRV